MARYTDYGSAYHYSGSLLRGGRLVYKRFGGPSIVCYYGLL